MSKKIFYVVFFIIFLSCSLQTDSEPSVEITKIPMAEHGGTVRLEPIEGRVKKFQPDNKIVLYARSGEWYVQPFADKVFTDIHPDSKWANLTHLGTEYAALLVTKDFVPQAKIHTLPEKSSSVLALRIVSGTPRYWQTWWFRTILILIGIFLLVAFLRLRFQKLTGEMNVRFEERLAERTRIAQELHDSLLQGFVGVSMQINVAAAQLPEDSPAKPQLNKIAKTIDHVIEEGRNTVQGLRAFDEEDFINLESRLSQIKNELDMEGKMEFQFVEKNLPRKLCPIIADEIYHISREALVNALHHANADKIEVETDYGEKDFKISIRDDGFGIDSKIIETGRDRHWGISGMRERAEKIGANLKISSRKDHGTEIELSIPNHIAFEPRKGKNTLRWLTKFYKRERGIK